MIPLALAALIVVCMVAASHRGIRYESDVSTFLASTPADGETVRLDGTIRSISPYHENDIVTLCNDADCVRALVPVRFRARLSDGAHVILTGIYREQTLHVSDVLTRCHDSEKRAP